MIYEPMAFGQSSMTGPFGSQPASSSADPYTRSSQFGGTSTNSSQFGFQPPSRQTDNTNNTNSFAQVSPFPPFGSTGSSQFGGMLPWNSQFVSQPPSRQMGNTSTNFFPQVSLFPPFGTLYTPASGRGPASSQTRPMGSTIQQAQPEYETNTLGLTTPFGAPSQPAFGLQLPLLVVPQAPMFFVSQQPQYLQQQFPQQMVPQFSHPLGLQQIRCSVVLDFGYQVPQKLEPQVPPVSSGQNTSPFGTPIASVAQSPFSTKSSVGGRLGFSQQAFWPRQGGTRVETFVSTATEVSGSVQNLQSISAMFVYGDKSHEELRWEDHQRGDKGGHKLPASAPVNPFRSASHSFLPENTFFGPPILDPFSSLYTNFPRFQPAFGSAFGSSLPFGESLMPACSSSPSTFGPSTVGSSSTTDHAKPSGSFQSFRPSFECPTVTLTSPFGYSFPSGSSSSLSNGTTTTVFISSPSNFDSVRRSTLAFGSSQASGNTPSSGLSQASTASIGQAPSLFGPTSVTFGSSQTHVDSESDCFQFAYSPIRQEPSLFGGSTTPTSSSGSSVLHSSTVESSSGFGSPLSFGNGNTQSTGISQSSTPSIGQRTSQSGPNASEFTFPSFISDPFRTLRISVQQPSQSASQPAAPVPTAFHSLFGCAPSASLSAPLQTTAAPAFPISEFGKPTGSNGFVEDSTCTLGEKPVDQQATNEEAS